MHMYQHYKSSQSLGNGRNEAELFVVTSLDIWQSFGLKKVGEGREPGLHADLVVWCCFLKFSLKHMSKILQK